jgi:hypothetical protein
MDFLWGVWNGITAWPLLLIHAFGGWERFPIYDLARDGGWYQLGFLLGAGSPFLGLFGRSHYTARPAPRPRPRTGRRPAWND